MKKRIKALSSISVLTAALTFITPTHAEVCFDSGTCNYEGFMCVSDGNKLKSEYNEIQSEYNECVDDYNELLEKHRKLIDKYNELIDEFRKVEKSNDMDRLIYEKALRQEETIDTIRICLENSRTLRKAKRCGE